jgi:hypothetical protein
VSHRPPNFWQPKVIRRYIDSRESSTQVILVNTDLGDGYLKAMGNPEGEHALACEWVGTQLALWLGLPTFEFGIIEVTMLDELSFHRKEKGKAKPGPAFISRSDPGEPWGGKERELQRLVNPRDISRLVVFDTWVRNPDRYYVRPDGSVRQSWNNVFLSEDAPPGKVLLRAMDHSHAFTNGREITPKNLGIDQIQDNTLYGLFPEFRLFLDRKVVQRTCKVLRTMNQELARSTTDSIPSEWDVSASGRTALAEFIVARANFVAGSIITCSGNKRKSPSLSSRRQSDDPRHRLLQPHSVLPRPFAPRSSEHRRALVFPEALLPQGPNAPG